MITVDYSKIPESDTVVNYILTRLRKGLYSLVLVTGLPGSGKSSTCLRLRELIDERRQIKSQPSGKVTIDTLLELLGALRSSKPGDVLVIEELSVLFPSRRAMSRDNVAIGRILDTCRKKQVILITNAPLLKSIDSHIRALSNVLVETQRVNRTEGVVISKAFRLQTDVRSSKTYTHRFTKNGKDIHLIFTRKPSKELWELYENEKDKFIDRLYLKIQSEQDKKDAKENKEKGVKPLRPLTKKELEVYDLYFNQKLTMQQIADKLGGSFQNIGYIVQNIRKKANIPKKIEHFKVENENIQHINLNSMSQMEKNSQDLAGKLSNDVPLITS